jgi:choline dehydrogenase-like flavoprotein
MRNNHVNAVVVGAGAGGGVVAKELSTAGLSVVLFERGDWVSFEDHDNDELLSQRTTVLGNAFGPDDDRYRRVVVGGDGSTEIVYPSDGAYSNIAACVGSGTVSYGAMAWRFMAEDFRMKSTYGTVEGSTL